MPDASSFPCRFAFLAGALGAALSCAPDQSANRAPSPFTRRDAGTREAAAGDSLGGNTQNPPDAASGPGEPPFMPPPDAARPPGEPIDPPPPAADAGGPRAELLQIERRNPGTVTTDLTMAGTLDWMHFGFQGGDGVNRKRGNGPPLILMSSLGSGFSGRSSADFSRFIWSDGTPVSAARNVQSGFETSTAGAGFQITVLGDPERPRAVRLYVGSQQGRAKLTVRFGNFGMPVHVDRLNADDTERNRVYTLVFQPANAERTLIVEWIIDGAMSNVRLQAVTLSDATMIAAP
jgi:hypothetical protein